MAQKPARGLRVLFIHGSEAEANRDNAPLASYLQAQAEYLEWHFGIFPSKFLTAEVPLHFLPLGNSRTSKHATWNLSVQSHAAVVRSFKPDVVIGSSLGGTIVLQLLQDKKWNGPTVLLAPLLMHQVQTVGAEDPMRPMVTLSHFRGLPE